jgi:hypothetical protein
MNSSSPQKSGVNPAFARLLSFVAISQTGKGDQTLEQLLLQCPVFFPSDAYAEPEDFGKSLNAMFGLEIPRERIQRTIDNLVARGSFSRPHGHQLAIRPDIRIEIEGRVDEARLLQERVQARWKDICQAKCPGVDATVAWLCLQEYLFRLFRRHGLQTVALLNNTVARTDEHASVLRANLSEVLKDKCPLGDRPKVESAVNQFLATVGSDQERTAYIVQLADGAFNYYSLSAPPEVAVQLQSQLKPLILFLDTNFLFGAFGLDTNPLVAVSQELLNAISKHNLPFKLRYHRATDVEMRRTITAIACHIKSRHWSTALSRAAASSQFVSGIERHFHEENAKNSIDPDTFFKPYEHFDVLLKDRGITIYREQPQQGQLETRADLIARYTGFLSRRNRTKPYEAIDHDMTVLDSVRRLRSSSTSSLEAKALIITCDTNLNRFDWQSVETSNGFASTVLPSHFLQLLRPYLPASQDFDRSFAETFAIPEFRAISGGYHIAATRLLSLLATYKDVREETASSLLANTLLLEELQRTANPQQISQLVEAAIVAENVGLLEERVLLRAELERKGAETQNSREAANAQFEALRSERDRLVDENQQISSRAEQVQKQVELSREELATLLRQTEKNVVQMREQIDTVQEGQLATARRLARMHVTLWLSFSIIGCLTAELLIHLFDWKWLLHHPNSYAIRSLIYVGLIAFVLGLVRREWRTAAWLSAGVTILVGLLSVLGGPALGH